MKDAEFTIEFVTHCLATADPQSKKKGDNCDRFERDSNGSLIWHINWWYSAMNETIKLSNIRGLKPGDVKISVFIQAPVKVYKRKYREDSFRNHEAIFPQTQVKFEAVVADNVTEGILHTVLERMGKFVGLSPYGNQLGNGRFTVIGVKVQPSANTIV